MLDRDYYDEKKYTDAEVDMLNFLWLDLSDEYFRIKNDDKAKVYLNKRSEELFLRHQIKLLKVPCDMLVWIVENQNIIPRMNAAEMVLRTYNIAKNIHSGIKITEKKGIDHNLSSILSVQQGLVTKYNLKFKQRKKTLKEEAKANPFDAVAAVEQVLGRSIGNIEKMSVEQWLSYDTIAKKKSANLKSQRNGGQHSKRNR